jgi:hypothetical protein
VSSDLMTSVRPRVISNLSVSLVQSEMLIKSQKFDNSSYESRSNMTAI